MRKTSVVFILLVYIVMASATSLQAQGNNKALCRSWIMSKMDMEGSQYSEEMVERQQRNGIVTVLQFAPNGACYVKISTSKGKTTKRNQWKLLDNNKQLVLQPEVQNQAQTFDIIKLTSKVMILSIEENGVKSTFHYKAYKEK